MSTAVSNSFTVPAPGATSALEAAMAALSPGQWSTFATGDGGSDPIGLHATLKNDDAAKSKFPFTDAMIWAPESEKAALMFGPDPGRVHMHVYDAASNTWYRKPIPAGFQTDPLDNQHGYSHSAYDPATQTYYASFPGDNQVDAFDMVAETWTEAVIPTTNLWGGARGAVASKFWAGNGYWRYITEEIVRWNGSSWDVMFTGPGGANWALSPVSAYRGVFGVTNCMFFGGYDSSAGSSQLQENELYKIVYNSGPLNSPSSYTISIIAAMPGGELTQNWDDAMLVVDPVSGDLLCLKGTQDDFGQKTPTYLYVYDVSQDSWGSPVDISAQLIHDSAHAVVFEAYNGIVLISGDSTDTQKRMSIYRHS